MKMGCPENHTYVGRAKAKAADKAAKEAAEKAAREASQ